MVAKVAVLFDDSPAGRATRAFLAGFPRARFVDLDNPHSSVSGTLSGYVLAADLARPGALGRVLRALKARSPETPMVAVAGATGWHDRALASSLGANRIVPASDLAALVDDSAISTALGLGLSDSDIGSRAAASEAEDLIHAIAGGSAIASSDASVKGAVDAACEALGGEGIERWLEVVRDIHDATYRHVVLVFGLSIGFGLAVRLPQSQLRKLGAGSLLHDVGKAKVPVHILDKPGRLDAEERAEMERHTVYGYEMLKAAGERDADVLDCVLSHHEKMDGSGYPNRLSSRSIRPLTRMLTIADIFAALIEERVYRASVGRDDAFEHLRSMGSQLDQGLVSTFRAIALAERLMGPEASSGSQPVSMLRTTA